MEENREQQKPDSENEKARDFFIGITLRGAVTLKKALKLKEEDFLRVVGYSHYDSRAYYLYGVLDEVLKAATAMIRWKEWLGRSDLDRLQETQHEEDRDHIARVVDEALADEQNLWSRKLAELLSDLLIFESTNTQESYHLYLTCKQLDAYLGLQTDFHEFFGCKNLNAQESIKSLLMIIAHCAKSLDLKKIWFLNDSIKWEKPLKPGTLFRSSRFRYKLALEKAAAEEKLTLGISYEKAYSMPSRSIHGNIGGPTVDVNHETIRAAFSHVALLCAQIILQSHKLSGVALTGDAAFVDKIQKSGTDARKIIESVSGKKLEIGDIVFAYGKDLCIIVDKNTSVYGYTSYKVKYLSQPLIPEVTEDWFPARYVHLVWPRKHVREQMIEIYENLHFPANAIERLRIMPDAEILDQMAATALKLFKDGMFDHLFKDPAQKSMRSTEPTEI